MRRGADVASGGPGQVRAVDRGVSAMGPSGSRIGPEAINLSQSHGASKNVVDGQRSRKGGPRRVPCSKGTSQTPYSPVD
jgi:hypothetical protein